MHPAIVGCFLVIYKRLDFVHLLARAYTKPFSIVESRGFHAFQKSNFEIVWVYTQKYLEKKCFRLLQKEYYAGVAALDSEIIPHGEI